MYVKHCDKTNTYYFIDMNKPEDLTEFLKYMNKTKEKEEIKYVAQEIARNMLQLKLKGDLIVNCGEVINIIYDKDLSKELNEVLKKIKNNEKIESKNKFGGKGLSSILLLGWDIVCDSLQEGKSYCVKAIKSKSPGD